ncbi:alpha/beta hydrolase [Arthrobacter sp. zg-Y769]|uniref:alpha/beta hydrolase n=1 Tax=Arthrobacter sp. zg-Y769 TaxID=2894191 RepID=UPI001E53EDC2|nr:alpha/beta hydrolase [Arthrobacter sp. zg-Y769]MCC9206296.1 alpha/beta hydrolase family protein [Arthrobacter sp. zg-Y769]
MKIDFGVDTSKLRDLPAAEPIQAAAADMLASAIGFRESISSIRNKWSAMDTLYAAPERDQVLKALDKPSENAESHLENVSSAVNALNDFAAELAEVKAAREDLEARIRDEEFRIQPIAEEMGNDDGDWDGAHALVDRAAIPYLNEAAELEDRYERARAACESVLRETSRASSHVVSAYDAPQMDLETDAAEDLASSFAAATKADASAEDIAAFYRLLGEMGPAQMEAFVAAVPAAALFVKGMGAYAEASFWKSLTPAQRAGLETSMPGLLGNLEGAPYGTRSRANREVLDQVISSPGGYTDEQFDAFLAIRDSLYRVGPEPRGLIAFDPTLEHPTAAVSIGFLDEAANATYLVPGMDSYSTNMGDLVDNALLLAREQKASTGSNQAVVAYMGYETPGVTEVLSDAHADAGSKGLADALDGVYLTRTAGGLPAPDVNVVAHSYGTTLTTKALGQTLYPVTSAVYLGSAGVDEFVTAEHLNVDRGADGRRDVYVTTADGDGLAGTGIWGTEVVSNFTSRENLRIDPTDETWGGKGFSSEGLTTADGKELEKKTDKHDLVEYLKVDSSSLRGIVMATTGEGKQLMEGSVGK